jgi:dihydrodipicolinate synthase/N-acetylneuraminate lyase
MGQIRDGRIRISEEDSSFTESDLASLVREIDTRTLGSNQFVTINRTSGLISSIDFYKDATRTLKKMHHAISRTTGLDNVQYITGVVITTFNDDGSIDSTITKTLSRDVDNKITSCDSVFYTTEAPC